MSGSDENGTPGAPEKPEGAQVSEHLNIKVTDNNNEVFFKIKRTTALKKLMDAFCERQGKAPNSVRFLFDGSRVQPTDSPDTVGKSSLESCACAARYGGRQFSFDTAEADMICNSSICRTVIPWKSTRSRSAEPNRRPSNDDDESADMTECYGWRAMGDDGWDLTTTCIWGFLGLY